LRRVAESGLIGRKSGIGFAPTTTHRSGMVAGSRPGSDVKGGDVVIYLIRRLIRALKNGKR